ncbi:MAG TPA: DUF1961 domain-containing protein [Candidatus Latescibacteria bacterium]|nr:DUF1961 domain-containing protein [Candidatus Latescibacterota bacterium]
MTYELTDTLYENALTDPTDVVGFRMEGEAAVTFPQGRMRMENCRDPGEGQAANFVYWCPEDFQSDITVTWDWWPVREPGLCILFFSAKGREGQNLFDSSLDERAGEYKQYHSSDINALHVSYFRRKASDERAFQTCNLRKSHGFHLVCQGADPLPSVCDATPPYHIKLIKCENHVVFSINELLIFDWVDDETTYGPILGGGKIGFRQMAPLIGEYANLVVSGVVRA